MCAGVQDFGRELLGSLRDHIEDSAEGTRHIIFVCHSLGGIVCKQALLYAHEDAEGYGRILQSTLGVVFLATPHRGSDIANLANIFFTIANTCQAVTTVGLRPTAARTELLEYLTRNSKALQDLITSVRHSLKSLSVVTFYESKFMPPLSSLIVDSASAHLGIANEEAMPLWEDHRSICRFDCETSDSYRRVARAIRRIARQSPSLGPTLRRASTHSSIRNFDAAESASITLLNDFDLAQYDQNPPKPVAGCGKTTLSSALAQHFKDIGEPSQNVLLFLCQNKNKQTDARAVLRGLIFQIVGRHRSMIVHVRKVYDLHGQSMVQSLNHLWGIFLRILQDPKSGLVYVVLDALDECERTSCLQLLESISDMLCNPFYSVQKGVRVKFLLTSRPFLHESYAATKPSLQSTLSIDQGQPGYLDDLQKFIRKRVDEISQSRQFSSDVREYLYQSMILKADGTFLWIQIVLASLEKSLLTAKSDLKKIIAGLPEDLTATYKRYLASIAVDHQSVAARFLKLLLGSSRPLHLDELNVAFTMEAKHITVDDISQDIQGGIAHTIQAILGPLIRVSEMQVSFVHQTVKEFLLTESVEELTLPALRTVTDQGAALCLATACIQYLLLDDFQVDFFTAESSFAESLRSSSRCLGELPMGDFWDDDSHDLDSGALYGEPDTQLSDISSLISSDFKFYSYAALHWAEHFAACEELVPDHLQSAARSLLDADTACCRNWLHFYRTKLADSTDDDAFGKDPVVLAAQFNITTVLRDLLGTHEPSQATKDRSLYWAARLGHNQVVTALLRVGADPNSQELERQTALTSASEQGNLACVVALLADQRADVNAAGREGRTALSFACGGGYDDIVRELLQHSNCKDDEPDYSGATPFFWAAGGGHFTTVSILARRGSVDTNHRDKRGRTALSWAAGDGMADMLTKLLKIRGVGVELADKKGRSPLSWAAGNGRVGTVEVLLRTAAVDKSSVDNDKRSAISWASAGGHYEVLVRLLDAGCPGVDAEDIDGWTPLMWAIQTDAPDTVQALIDSNQVQLERRDRGRRTALDWARAYRHTNVINVLLRATGHLPTTTVVGSQLPSGPS
ncbi:uncharacterized protein LMH87_008602 [Akanthomyces muscarius]|uniref:Ankyrin repeat protein n=1 Tax=Akanthomyces muscarius TaxID=2231603 RepID=A0A9W8QJI1_AKAMU|nr:uncharacterized protein LMH87_008602 [Akanthomyces muscarius]KAJ4158057.1 hypothetical protein LMH87_008602 [Akanthomyces muscarius]